MTKLEQAARQALEAIETSRGQWIHSVNATVCLDTITALREALAEPAEQEPVAKAIKNNIFKAWGIK